MFVILSANHPYTSSTSSGYTLVPECLSASLTITDSDANVVQYSYPRKGLSAPNPNHACRIRTSSETYTRQAGFFLGNQCKKARDIYDVSDIYIDEYSHRTKEAYVKWSPVAKYHAKQTAGFISKWAGRAWNWASPRIKRHLQAGFEYTQTDEFWDGVASTQKKIWKGICYVIKKTPHVVKTVATACKLLYKRLCTLAKTLAA
ncbi:hypothetical protein K504DRAFT_522277 [Pleomassaria siparia CBS 279.74]|uniref:Uncharacterized protein n=1 Tax=Pleomassaria siparia CBS 279.74 TaxID=1314801 RepID=A0A6G1KIS6_9PLEO|nr:hypothetical protein K504DRAFT_522277 [Pleomassaria siparia CBS 279.74]